MKANGEACASPLVQMENMMILWKKWSNEDLWIYLIIRCWKIQNNKAIELEKMAKSSFLYIASSKEVVNEEIKEWRILRRGWRAIEDQD